MGRPPFCGERERGRLFFRHRGKFPNKWEKSCREKAGKPGGGTQFHRLDGMPATVIVLAYGTGYSKFRFMMEYEDRLVRAEEIACGEKSRLIAERESTGRTALAGKVKNAGKARGARPFFCVQDFPLFAC